MYASGLGWRRTNETPSAGKRGEADVGPPSYRAVPHIIPANESTLCSLTWLC